MYPRSRRPTGCLRLQTCLGPVSPTTKQVRATVCILHRATVLLLRQARLLSTLRRHCPADLASTDLPRKPNTNWPVAGQSSCPSLFITPLISHQLLPPRGLELFPIRTRAAAPASGAEQTTKRVPAHPWVMGPLLPGGPDHSAAAATVPRRSVPSGKSSFASARELGIFSTLEQRHESHQQVSLYN